jgi:hypothetical protein
MRRPGGNAARATAFPPQEFIMSFFTPELAERLAGYIVNRRDKRIITFSVLGLYAAALMYHFVGPALGAPAQKAALDSIEMLATVVVIAHIAAGTAQRVVAQQAVVQRDAAAAPARADSGRAETALQRDGAPPPDEKPAGRVVRTSRLLPRPRRLRLSHPTEPPRPVSPPRPGATP